MLNRRSSDVVVSTTGTLEGWTVTRYLDTVSAHVVAGTNVFSDIAASFSDLFGGRSSSYKKQLASINEEVTNELKEKAARHGADAILGLRIDHDEISGQQKGMLMVTATGTAVRAQPEAGYGDTDGENASGTVSARQLEVEGRTQELLQTASADSLPDDEATWRFLIENRISDLAEAVRIKMLNLLPRHSRSEAQKRLIERGRNYFLSIETETAKQHLYNMLYDFDSSRRRRVMEWVLKVLKEGQMLDFRWINALLSEEEFLARKRALEPLMSVEKPYYTPSDIEALRKLEERVTSEFEKRGEVLEVEESGMFSSETKKCWQIKEGVHNPMDREYCKQTGQNIYGFKKEETKPEEAAKAIRDKIELLEDLL